ncbi:hypothetical protein GGTG_07860 [Gaeumannomyces tritici R3-111a-1]|uniref:Uncharacterized protein n=1 Tax=Gaeumannomyces tritici (strain R3-111a-1) TaxID=644352 RepID=J3P2W8_GAET3|nr:hypothetical protein GGTG_07860 [Gaeumannomyces tritici R3-111a-1]EJT74010.1 hypothetical protein GGTG_07860 [Gaeumannomyces tritici R3-111a-1]
MQVLFPVAGRIVRRPVVRASNQPLLGKAPWSAGRPATLESQQFGDQLVPPPQSTMMDAAGSHR